MTNSAAVTQLEPKRKKGVALSGVVAGVSAICTVGHTGNDLHYRGYDILELAKYATFEEVAYLLIHGTLPTLPSWRRITIRLVGCAGWPVEVSKNA